MLEVWFLIDEATVSTLRLIESLSQRCRGYKIASLSTQMVDQGFNSQICYQMYPGIVSCWILLRNVDFASH